MRQSPGPGGDALGAREGLDVDRVFADPAFEPFKARGSGFAVVRPDTRSVVWANEAAATRWGAVDRDALGRALFGSLPADRTTPLAGWLAGLARGIPPGRPPQFARAGLVHGARMAPETVLVHAWTQPDGRVLMGFATAAANRPEPASPDRWRQDAWQQDAWQQDAWQRDAAQQDAWRQAPHSTVTPLQPDPEASPDAAAIVEPDAGETLARRSQLAVLHDRLSHGLDGASSLRLLWRTDATGAVTGIDAETLSRLGSPVRFGSEPLPDAVARFDPASAQAIRAAFDARATWSNLSVDLPVAEGAATAPLVLNASPTFAPDRSFAGFRGFALLMLGGLRLTPSRPRAAVPHRGTPGDAPSTDVIEPHRPTERQAEPASDPLPPRSVAANVVELRPFQAQLAARGDALASPAAPAEAERSAAAGGAPDDEVAFLALGAALRAEIGGDEDVSVSPIEPSPPPADRDAAPGPATPSSIEASSLLSQVPVALLVTAGAMPVFANPAAAALLDYPAPDEVVAAGEGLVLAEPAARDAGALTLRDGRGQAVTVEARGARVIWGADPATLWAMTRAAEPAAASSDDRASAQTSRTADAEGRAGELLDRVDDAVALLDSEGRIRRLNRQGETWFGRDGEALGQAFTRLLASESHAAALALLGDVRQQRDRTGLAPLNRDVLAHTTAPAPVPMLLTLGRLGLAGFYATLRDVTDLRRAEGESARAQRDHAHDADRLADLLAKVSHEIRTPLNAILGFAEVMVDERFGPLGNPRYRDYLKDIHAAGSQVVSLVGDMLDLSRIEAGQHDIDLGAVDVNRIVTEIVHKMQPEAHRQRVIMRTSLANRVPQVLADERSARQIVQNLLSNAVQFNEPGGQVIVSTTESDAGAVVLRIRDTGIGMTDEEISTALEPFGRGVAPREGGGNGLGLPLTRALVGANGASLAIRSRPREGTLVEVTFAVDRPEHARLPA